MSDKKDSLYFLTNKSSLYLDNILLHGTIKGTEYSMREVLAKPSLLSELTFDEVTNSPHWATFIYYLCKNNNVTLKDLDNIDSLKTFIMLSNNADYENLHNLEIDVINKLYDGTINFMTVDDIIEYIGFVEGLEKKQYRDYSNILRFLISRIYEHFVNLTEEQQRLVMKYIIEFKGSDPSLKYITLIDGLFKYSEEINNGKFCLRFLKQIMNQYYWEVQYRMIRHRIHLVDKLFLMLDNYNNNEKVRKKLYNLRPDDVTYQELYKILN